MCQKGETSTRKSVIKLQCIQPETVAESSLHPWDIISDISIPNIRYLHTCICSRAFATPECNDHCSYTALDHICRLFVPRIIFQNKQKKNACHSKCSIVVLPLAHPGTLFQQHIEILNDNHTNMCIDHYRCDTHAGFDLIHMRILEKLHRILIRD